MFQPIKKPLWRRIQEGFLFRRQFVERGKLGVVYGSDGLLDRLLKPGQAGKVRWWKEVRVGDISTDAFVVEEWVTALSQDGFDFRAHIRLEAKFNPLDEVLDDFLRLAVERCLHDSRWPGRVVVKPLVWEAAVQSMGSFSAAQLLVGQIWREFEQGIQTHIEEHLPKGFALTKLGLKQLLPPEELADMKKKSRGLWMGAMETQEIPPDAWERLIELVMSSQRPPPPHSGSARPSPFPESATWANGRDPSETPRYSARP